MTVLLLFILARSPKPTVCIPDAQRTSCSSPKQSPVARPVPARRGNLERGR